MDLVAHKEDVRHTAKSSLWVNIFVCSIKGGLSYSPQLMQGSPLRDANNECVAMGNHTTEAETGNKILQVGQDMAILGPPKQLMGGDITGTINKK